MSYKRIMAVAGRIVVQLARDVRAMALIIVAPLIIMTLFAFILGSEGAKPKVALKVDGTTSLFITDLEPLLEEADEEDEGFDVVDLPDDMSPDDAIRAGLVDAVLEFPSTFMEERASGKNSTLYLHVEGADPMKTASILSRFKKTVPDSLTGIPKFLPDDCDAHCADTIPDGSPEFEMTKLYGEDIEEQMDFFVPVLPPFFAFFFVFLLSGMAFLKERTGGTAERLLASPLTRTELVLGYIVGFFPAAIVQASVVILFTIFALDAPWGGWPDIITILLLTLTAECFGVFVSAFAKSEFQVFQFIPIIIVPQLLLCGIIWPLSDLPDWLAALAYVYPMTYATEAIRDVAIRGFGFAEVWPMLGLLLAYALASTGLAALSVKRSV